MAASTSASGLLKDRNVPGTSASSDNKEEELVLEFNMAERKSSTKTILEDVCMDFESMDVISPKANKLGVNKNVKSICKLDQSSKVMKNSAATKITETSDEKAAKDALTFSSNTQVKIIEPKEVELSESQIALVPEFESASNVSLNSEKYDQSYDVQDVTDIIDLPESAVKNIASLAQLADAEIVQTGDNVSIIVTNPRLIEVLTNPDSTTAVMDTGTAVLESNLGGTQPLNVISQTLLDDNIFQTMDIANVVQETVITEDGNEISSSSKSKARTVYGTIKGKTNKSLFKTVYSSPASTLKARRVTAKMKAEWARQIKRKGRLSCQVPGCSQTYITVANFITHYKYCTGKESLQLCLYCKSLIFSSHKAMSQHMEVEHPDKVEQFKAAYPFEEDSENEESSNKASSLILPEDDVTLNIAEVSQKNAKKCKLSSKENIVLPKRTILKHKIQSIQNSMAENAKEFKKCVKFDNIVDKINSVEDLCKLESVPSNKCSKPKEKRKRVILTESIVAEKKYFEDDEDDTNVEQKDEPEETHVEELHTKARMVLNKERYKRYKEYLKLTRDWSSERKTYSRGRGSDVSSDSSFLLNSLNESVEDVHQLSRTVESSSISLNATETELEMSSLPALESENVVSFTEASEKLIDSLISLANKTGDRPDTLADKTGDRSDTRISLADKTDDHPNNHIPLNDKTGDRPDCHISFDKMGDRPPVLVNETVTKESPNLVENNISPDTKIRRNRPCYSRAIQEVPPKLKPKYRAIITYGLNVPAQVSKPEEEPMTFDSLVNSFKSDSVNRNSQCVAEAVTEIESAPKLETGEGKIETAVVLKRKRGRPPKPKPESMVEVKKEAKDKIEGIKNVKNYTTAMLKSIEKNVKNRKIRLFGIKKNSKFKAKCKNYSHQSLSKQSSLKNQKSKQSKRRLIAKNIIKRRSVKGKSVDKSAIQCQENIDNHLTIGNESVISHIQCLPSDHNYTNSEVIGDNLVIDANNIVGEVEVITSNVDNVSQSVIEENYAKSVRSNLVNVATEKFPQCIPNVPAEETSEVSTSVQSEETEKEVERNVLDQNNQKCTDCSEQQQNDIAIELKTASIEHDAAVIPETQSSQNDALSTDKPSSQDRSHHPRLQTASIEHDAAVIPETQSSENEAISTDKPSSQETQRVCGNELSSQQEICEAEKISSNEQLENVLSQKDIQGASEVAEISNNEPFQSNVKEMQPLPDRSDKAGHSDSMIVKDNISGGAENNDSAIEKSAMVESPQVKTEQEVIVKRRRGRPKKNSVASPMTNVSNFASPLESTPIVNVDKSKMDAFKDSQVSIETPSLMTDDSAGTPNLRKSERVRCRKLVTGELLEASPIEIKPKEEIVTVRTGRRGRPRKYLAKETSADLSESKIEETILSTSQIETEPVLANRKLSRKSRPRKCVRYADLNTGIDSSESMDGLSGACTGKDKPESPKLKGRTAQKQSNETDLDNKKKIVECESNSNAQDSKIILPLKKRKQRQTKKEDPAMENADSTRSNEDPEVLLSNEEENTADAESKTPKRVRKGAKRKQSDRGTDTSDEEWDISNYLNSMKSSSRKRHQKVSTQELLELEEESSDSYSSEKDDPTVKLKKGSKKLYETSGNRRPSIKSFLRAKHLEMMIASKLQPKDNILQKYKPKKSLWTQLCDKDYYSALPSLKRSVFFKIENMWDKKESFWNSLDFFDSVPIDKESSHCTFFTGGPVLCSAWCPTPTSDEVQYVALASRFSTNKLNSYVSMEVEKCLVQLWNVGVLKEKRVQSKPLMELSIFLQCGPVADMVWCPDGCWEDPSLECVEDNLPRLGLLALACADSNVRIYSIPHPRCVTKEANIFPVFSASPSILLEPMHGEVCAVTRRSMCISVCWQKSDNFEHIAAGYGNGMICLWRINHSSTILAVEKDNELKFNPYLVFNAHGTPVYGISFASLPGNRFLVSSSIDKTLKFWDLIDTSVPFFCVKKGAGKGVEWASHYCGAFASLEHGMNCFKGCSFFKECGTEKFQSRTLSAASCGLMKSTLSEWLSAVALADMSGTVSASFIYNLLQEHPKSPTFLQKPIYKSELQLVEGIVDKIAFSCYPETMNVVSTLQEMSEIAGVMNNLIEKCCKDTSDLELIRELSKDDSQKSSLEDDSEKLGSIKCLTVVEEMTDIVSVVHKIQDIVEDEVCSENEQLLLAEVSHKDVSNGDYFSEEQILEDVGKKLSEIVDIVSAVSELPDVAHAVNDVALCLVKSCSEVEPIEKDTSMQMDLCSGISDVDEQAEIIHVTSQVLNETVTCVSALEGMTNSVSVMENLLENTCRNTDPTKNFDHGSKFVNTEQPIEEEFSTNSKTIKYLLQNIKDVVCTMCNITTEAKEPNYLDRVENPDMPVVSYEKESYGLEQAESKQRLVAGIGSPFDLAEITDVVSTLVDIKDTADIVSEVEDVVTSMTAIKEVIDSVGHLKDVTLVMEKLKNMSEEHFSKDWALPLRLIARHFVAQLPSLVDIDVNSIDDLISVVLKKTGDVGSPVVFEEAVLALSDALKNATKEIEVEQGVERVVCSLVSAVEKSNKSKDSDNQNLDTTLENEEIVRNSPTAVQELIPITVSAEPCINCRAEICHCLTAPPQNLNYKFSILPDEMDEPMLSAEGEESSGSENDTDSEDEIEVSNSYLFDQDSNFSGDSVLSECSLDSNISMCSSSGDSDISEVSSGSAPGEQGNPDIGQDFIDFEILLPESHTNNPANVTESPSNSVCDIAAEGINVESCSNVAVAQELQVESMDIDLPSDLVVSSSHSCDIPVENGIKLPCDEIHKMDESDSPEVLNVPQSVEIVSELLPDEDDFVIGRPSEEAGLADNCETTQQINKLYNANSVSVEVVHEDICISSELCEKSDSNTVNNTHSKNDFEANCESVCVGSKTVEIAGTAVSNIDNICDEAMNSAVDSAVVNSERRNLLSTKSFLTYEDIVSEYGIVFKDMNTAQFESIQDKKSEEVNSLLLDHYHLPSIKALAWNPNFGSHSWLFSAGLSGLARLSYVSDINQPNTSEKTEVNDA